MNKVRAFQADFFNMYFSIILHLRIVLPSRLFPAGFPTVTLYKLLSLLYVLRDPSISSSFTWSPQ